MKRRMNLAVPLWKSVVFSGYRSRYGLDFDAVDDYVNFGSPAALDDIFDGGGTIGGWAFVRSDGEGDSGMLFSKRVGSTGWFLNTEAESAGYVKLGLYAITTDPGATDYYYRTTSAVIPINAWTHIVVITNLSTLAVAPKIYINGVAVALTKIYTASGDRVSDAANNLWLGSQGGAYTYDGLMRNMFVANREMTATEVTEAYHAGSPGDLSVMSFWSDVIAWWKMGDGDTYPTILDSKGSNNGTMTNMTVSDIVGV